MTEAMRRVMENEILRLLVEKQASSGSINSYIMLNLLEEMGKRAAMAKAMQLSAEQGT